MRSEVGGRDRRVDEVGRQEIEIGEKDVFREARTSVVERVSMSVLES